MLHGLGTPLLTAMVLLMGAVGLVAAVGPARRGLEIAPAEVLSGE
jgi:ABC-type antimicrobial peptide transport system permease subunit